MFHSEADFQHAFAWEIRRRLPNAGIRLERPLAADGVKLHLDFFAQTPEQAVAVELKYKTRKLSIELGSEEFRLADQSAQDIGRYDFIKDVCRLERIGGHVENCTGWAILLTNDSAYWKPAITSATVDRAFRIAEGRVLHGSLVWTEKASAGTKHGREASLEVRGKYMLGWSDYSVPSKGSYGQFRYLAVHVPRRV